MGNASIFGDSFIENELREPDGHAFGRAQDETLRDAFVHAVRRIAPAGAKLLVVGGSEALAASLIAAAIDRVWWIAANHEPAGKTPLRFDARRQDERLTIIQSKPETFLPPAAVDAVICPSLVPAMLSTRRVAWIESFNRRYASRFGGTRPVYVPGRTLLSVHPVEHPFCFTRDRASLSHFQAPSLRNEHTRELGASHTFADVSYTDSLPTTLSCDRWMTIRRAGRLNGVRIETTHVMAETVGREPAVLWPDQLLVVPLRRPLQTTAGERVHVRFEYETEGTLRSLYESVSVELEEQASFDREAA